MPICPVQAEQAQPKEPVRQAPSPPPASAPQPNAAGVSPAISDAASGAPDSAEGLWTAALEELKRQNVLIHAVAVSGVAQRLADGVLTVAFPEARSAQYNSMCAPINHTKVQGIVAALPPGPTVTFVKAQPRPLPPETEARARELFGDKLTVD